MWEKQAGMLDKKRKASLKEQLEISKRATEVGKQIHLANVERDMKKLDETKQAVLNQQIATKMEEGMTLEQATEAINKESENG
jgi:type II secretory pathway component PulF